MITTKQQDERLYQQIKYLKSIYLLSDEVFNEPLADHHMRMIKFIENNRYTITHFPRDHGKTQTLVKYCTQKILQDRNIRILYISAKLGAVAEESLRKIKDTLASSLLTDLYGQFKTHRWNSFEFSVIRSLGIDAPTFKARSVNSQDLRGSSADIIILDDIAVDLNSNTETKRHNLRSIVSNVITPAMREGNVSKIIVVGTPIHFDDIYQTMLKSGIYRLLKMPAILEGDIEDPQNIVYDESYDNYGNLIINDILIKNEKSFKLLWPARWTIKSLLERKRFMDEYDPTSFYREYQVKLISDTTAKIKLEWLEKSKDYLMNFVQSKDEIEEGKYRYIIQSWDLSFLDKKKAEDRDSDYTVGLTIGVDKDWNKHILNMYMKRGFNNPRELLNDIKNLAFRFDPKSIFVENNAFQSIVVQDLRNSTDLPIIPHNTTAKNKHSLEEGITYMATHIQNGKVKIPFGRSSRIVANRIISNLHGYGHEPHDDIVMALWIGILGIKKIQKQESDFAKYEQLIGEN